MQHLIVILLTIVILDPYSDIDYDEINVYYIDLDPYQELDINIYEGNKCLEEDGCYEGNASPSKSKETKRYTPLIFHPSYFYEY